MPFNAPSVSQNPNQQGWYEAPQATPFRNYAPAQIAAAGEGIERLGRGTQALGSSIQHEVDSARLKERSNMLSDATRTAMTKFAALKGKAAYDGQAEIMAELEDSRRSIEGGLENEYQRAHFSALADDTLSRTKASITEHAGNELRSYQVGESKARHEAAAADAVLAVQRNDDQSGQDLALSRSIMLQEANALADLAQLPADSAQRKQLQMDSTTQFHQVVIEQLINDGRTNEARSWLGAHKAEIDVKQKQQLEDTVKRAGVNDESTRLQMQLLAPPDAATVEGWGLQDPTKAPLSERWMHEREVRLQTSVKALDKVDELFKNGQITAEVRDATRSRIFSQNDAGDRLEADRRMQVRTEAEKWLTDNPGQPVRSLPAATYNSLEYFGLLGEMHGFADSQRYTTDPAALEEAMGLPDFVLRSISHAQLRERYRGRLNDGDLAKVEALQAKALGTANPKQTTIVEKQRRIEDFAVQAGLLTKNGKDWEQQMRTHDYYGFLQRVEAKVHQFELTQLQGKREASGEELQKILDKELLEKVTLDGREVPVIAPRREDLQRATVDYNGATFRLGQISDEDRDKIVKILQETGEPVSQKRIVEEWVRWFRPR